MCSHPEPSADPAGGTCTHLWLVVGLPFSTAILFAPSLLRTHLREVGGLRPPIHLHCVLHAKRGGGVQIACKTAYVLNGRPPNCKMRALPESTLCRDKKGQILNLYRQCSKLTFGAISQQGGQPLYSCFYLKFCQSSGPSVI